MSEDIKNVFIKVVTEAPYIAGFLLLAYIQWTYNQDLLVRITQLTAAVIACSTR